MRQILGAPCWIIALACSAGHAAAVEKQAFYERIFKFLERNPGVAASTSAGQPPRMPLAP